MNISTPGEKGVLIMCFMLVCAGAEQKERETERETERERERIYYSLRRFDERLQYTYSFGGP